MTRPETTPKTPLAERLRQARRALGDPKRELLAKTLGVSKISLAYYERGDNEPAAAALLAYIRLYNFSAHWLLTGEGEMFNKGGKKNLLQTESDINAAHLEQAVHIVEKALTDSKLSADKKAELIKLVAAMLRNEQDIEPIKRVITILS